MVTHKTDLIPDKNDHYESIRIYVLQTGKKFYFSVRHVIPFPMTVETRKTHEIQILSCSGTMPHDTSTQQSRTYWWKRMTITQHWERCYFQYCSVEKHTTAITHKDKRHVACKPVKKWPTSTRRYQTAWSQMPGLSRHRHIPVYLMISNKRYRILSTMMVNNLTRPHYYAFAWYGDATCSKLNNRLSHLLSAPVQGLPGKLKLIKV